MRLSSVLAFVFDIDGTLVDSNELHVDSWDRAFRRFGKQFPREQLRAQIGKGSDQYLPEFLTPEEIKRFGKELDEYRSELFRKGYLPKVQPFPKVRELFQRIHDDNKRSVLASSGKKADTKYYVDLLKIGDLIDGYVSGDDADSSAKRYAKLLVSEIKLYHEPAVVAGRRERDLAMRLGGEIARARVLYEQRVPQTVRSRTDYFRDELVRTLANGDATLLHLSREAGSPGV